MNCNTTLRGIGRVAATRPLHATAIRTASSTVSRGTANNKTNHPQQHSVRTFSSVVYDDNGGNHDLARMLLLLSPSSSPLSSPSEAAGSRLSASAPRSENTGHNNNNSEANDETEPSLEGAEQEDNCRRDDHFLELKRQAIAEFLS